MVDTYVSGAYAARCAGSSPVPGTGGVTTDSSFLFITDKKMKLYIVPTPIGNMEDITLRALNVLKGSDLILCEDTRTTGNLLKRYDIVQRCAPYHIFNEHEQTARYVNQIKVLNQVSLVSDAGTPGISDPGYLLVRACISEGIEVECLPGATAFVPALIQSGLPCSSFYFHGFLPHKKGKESLLKRLSEMEETSVLYESPHRLLKSLEKMAEIMGPDRRISVSREISKIYADTFRGTLSEAIEHFSAKEVKGEFVIVLSGKD